MVDSRRNPALGSIVLPLDDVHPVGAQGPLPANRSLAGQIVGAAQPRRTHLSDSSSRRQRHQHIFQPDDAILGRVPDFTSIALPQPWGTGRTLPGSLWGYMNATHTLRHRAIIAVAYCLMRLMSRPCISLQRASSVFVLFNVPYTSQSNPPQLSLYCLTPRTATVVGSDHIV